MKVGVVVFPGSNCDHDTVHVLGEVCGQDVRLVWHKDSDLSDLDAAEKLALDSMDRGARESDRVEERPMLL